jgi:hypothetical protein
MPVREEFVDEARKIFSRSGDPGAMLRHLQARGASKIESIAVLTLALGFSLQESRDVVDLSEALNRSTPAGNWFRERISQAKASELRR